MHIIPVHGAVGLVQDHGSAAFGNFSQIVNGCNRRQAGSLVKVDVMNSDKERGEAGLDDSRLPFVPAIMVNRAEIANPITAITNPARASVRVSPRPA